MELTIVGALTITVTTVIIFIMIGGSESFRRINTNQQTTSNLQRVMLDELYQSVRLASVFPESVEVNGVTYSSAPDDPNQSTSSLVMQLPIILNSSGQPGTDPSQVDTIVYTEKQDGIHRIVDPNPSSFRQAADQLIVEDAKLAITQLKQTGTQKRLVRVSVTLNGRTVVQDMVARND